MTTPAIPPHPGEALRDLLDKNGISQSKASSDLGISRQHLNSIVNGHNPVSADLKLKLHDYLQIPPSHWATLQEERSRFERSTEGRRLTFEGKQQDLIDELEMRNRTLLVDHEIENAARSGWLGIEPFTTAQLARTGYWLSLGLRGSLYRLEDPDAEEKDVVLKPGLELRQGEVLTVLSHEKLRLPSQLEATFATADDLFSGASPILSCKRHFDSGLHCQISMQISHHARRPLTVHHRQLALKLQFHFLPHAPARDHDFNPT